MPRSLARLFTILLLLASPDSFARLVTSAPSEFVKDARPVASLGQLYPRVASNGDMFLSVWLQFGTGAPYDVYAARVTAGGEVLDEHPLVVATGALAYPDVVWTGEAFLVSWLEGTQSKARTVAPDGTMGMPVVIDSVPSPTSALGSSILAVSSDRVLALTPVLVFPTGARSFHGTLLTRSGDVLQRGIEIANYSGQYPYYDLTASRSEFLLCSARFPSTGGHVGDIVAVRISRDGIVNSPEVLASDQPLRDTVRAASDGAGFAVLWETAGTTNEIRGVVSSGGGLGPVRRMHDGGDLFTVNGVTSGYLMTFGVDALPFAAAIDTSGNAGPPHRMTPDGLPGFTATSAAFDGARTLVALQPIVSGDINLDIFGVFVANDGTPESPVPFWLARSPLAQQHPASARGVGQHLVTWIEQRPHEARVVAAAAIIDDETGQVSSPVILGDADWYADQPRAAFDGTDYLVVWSRGDSVMKRRVSAAGELLDPQPSVVTTTGSGRLELAWNGSNYLVGWIVVTSASLGSETFFGARVSADGTLLDAQRLAIASPETRAATLFESEGETAFLATRSHIEGGIVTRSGITLHSMDVDGKAYEFDSRQEGTPLIAFLSTSPDGVASIGLLEFEHGSIVNLRTFPPRGIPMPGGPSIARIGEGRSLVAWTEGTALGDSDIVGMEVDDDGNVISGVRTLVGGPLHDAEPLLLASDHGVTLLFVRTEPGPAGIPHLYTMRISHEEPDRRRAVRK